MTTYTENNVNYGLGKGSMEVLNSPNATGNIEIKSSITLNSVVYQVTNIRPYAFQNNTNITGVIIPSTITYIYFGAFQGCTQLSKVYFKGLSVCESDSFSPVYLPDGALAGTVYIKEEFRPPDGSEMPDWLYYLTIAFNVVYLASSVIDAFAFTPAAPTIPAQPIITNIRSTGGVTSISFQNPSDTSITNYAYSTINVVDIDNSVLPLPPFSSYTLLSPAQATSPLTISGLHGVVQIKIKAFNGSYSNESTAVNNWYQPPFV